MKLMAPIFQAFDRLTYQWLVPQHLKDLTCMPQSILQHLQAGGFSVRLSASEWHAVALDECHEMRINRDAKLAVIRPNPQRMEHLSNYLSFRAACANNLSAQLFPERATQSVKFTHRTTSKDRIAEVNIQRMFDRISEHGMFRLCQENQGMWNFLVRPRLHQSRSMTYYIFVPLVWLLSKVL